MKKWSIAGVTTVAMTLLVSALWSPTTVSGQAPAPPPQPMGFFVTSVGSGSGGNLGGLAGADKHCQSLAAAAGAGNRT